MNLLVVLMCSSRKALKGDPPVPTEMFLEMKW